MANLRGPDRKSVGKPDAGNRHVRFDERGRETGLLAPRPSSTLPSKLLKIRKTNLPAMFISEEPKPEGPLYLTPPWKN